MQGLKTGDVDDAIKDAAAAECIVITLDTQHFLHSTTAREISNRLLDLNGLPVTITLHGVDHSTGGATARTLTKALLARINEWNHTIGIMTVVAEPDLAVQQADGLQKTIRRAYGGCAVVQWLDEVISPDET